jgi:Domain of unknown function (DUF6471)
MTEDEYNAGVRNIPLFFDRDTTDGTATIYRKPNGDPVRNKVARGRFSAVFLVQCLAAMGVYLLRIEDVDAQ